MTVAKKHVYRVGDKVRILTPKFVARVGYPLTVVDVRHEIEEHSNLDEAMRLLGIETLQWAARRDFIHGAACALVRLRRFGGKERTIHYIDGFQCREGLTARIIGKRCVRTGTYYPPGGSYDDYEPGGLDNAKCHVLLLTGWGEIEACNVEPAA